MLYKLTLYFALLACPARQRNGEACYCSGYVRPCVSVCACEITRKLLMRNWRNSVECVLWRTLGVIFTARAYARAVLGVVILSVRPSVCPSVRLSHAWMVTKLNDALQIFYTTRKGNHSATLIPRVVGRRRPLPSEICVQSDPPPSKNADFDRFPLITSQP